MKATQIGNTLGQWLRKERCRRGKTLSKVAKSIGMQTAHLSKLERGDRPATPNQAAALAVYFEFDTRLVEARRIADLFMRENAYNPATLTAIGLLEEEAGNYGLNFREQKNNLHKSHS